MVPTSFARFGQAVAVAGSALAATGCVDIVANDRTHVEREEKRFTTTGSPLIDLKTFDGAIEVGSWDRARGAGHHQRGFDHSDVASIDVETSQNGDRHHRRRHSPQSGRADIRLASACRVALCNRPERRQIRARSW